MLTVISAIRYNNTVKHAHASFPESTITHINRDSGTWVDKCMSPVEPVVNESGKSVIVFNHLKCIMIIFLFRRDDRRIPPPHCTYHARGNRYLVHAATTSGRDTIDKWKCTHTAIKIKIMITIITIS